MIDLLYGRRPVYEALRAGRRRIYKLMLAEGVRERGKGAGSIGQIVSMARSAGATLSRSPRHELDRLTSRHQGVVAETSPYPYAGLDDILSSAADQQVPPLFLLLDLLQDPQNVGSLLRTAEAVGVHGVVIPRRRAVGVTPAVVSASAGAVEHLLVAQVTNLARTIDELKRRVPMPLCCANAAQGRFTDLWIAGLEADPDAQPYDQADLRGPLALVVGGEGSGLRRLVREKCDFLLRLPMRGRVASLNAAVAGSVALYEVERQRRAGDTGSLKH
jgi:23S rRNA (guanosine2251-2'-O)-methyltransferase